MRLFRVGGHRAKCLGARGDIDGAAPFNFPKFGEESGRCIETDQADGDESLQSAIKRRS